MRYKVKQIQSKYIQYFNGIMRAYGKKFHTRVPAWYAWFETMYHK